MAKLEKKLFMMMLPLLVLGIFGALAYNNLMGNGLGSSEVQLLELVGLIGLVLTAPLIKLKGTLAKAIGWAMVVVSAGLLLAIVPPLFGIAILPAIGYTIVYTLGVIGSLVAIMAVLE